MAVGIIAIIITIQTVRSAINLITATAAIACYLVKLFLQLNEDPLAPTDEYDGI